MLKKNVKNLLIPGGKCTPKTGGFYRFYGVLKGFKKNDAYIQKIGCFIFLIKKLKKGLTDYDTCVILYLQSR